MELDWCRHCLVYTQMTDEHLPPRAADNSSQVTLYNEQDGALVVVQSYLDGHIIPSLCASCNNLASHRGLPQAYTAWRDDVLSHLNLAAATYEYQTGGARTDLWRLQRPDGSAFRLEVEHGKDTHSKQMKNLHPGRIARQILGMILAVQESRSLHDDHPHLTSAYLSGEPTSIEPFSLHVAFADAGLNYFSSGVRAVTFDLGKGPSTDIDFWMVSFPPFLMCLVYGPKAPITATRIDQWLDQPVSAFFGKRERKISYPIANQSELLVATMYAALDGRREMQVDEAAP
ncbi:hypothetical protein ACXPWS_05280 [Mycobacterium sp. BMJ-28]